ncbi:MAG: hypothetical protein GBAus27B_000421 [Mycoplasmataceae bacterium]|nr:MAG: hypothetical protein GBAus27B_000421 [Mycoplasmataceae bacterium]
MSKKLQKKIKNKLEKLHELLDDVDEAKNVEPDDPETWDNDTLYNLIEKAKEIQQLLEDKIHSKEKNEFGEPIVLETGLCSLVDEYQNEEEENSEDF